MQDQAEPREVRTTPHPNERHVDGDGGGVGAAAGGYSLWCKGSGRLLRLRAYFHSHRYAASPQQGSLFLARTPDDGRVWMVGLRGPGRQMDRTPMPGVPFPHPKGSLRAMGVHLRESVRPVEDPHAGGAFVLEGERGLDGFHPAQGSQVTPVEVALPAAIAQAGGAVSEAETDHDRGLKGTKLVSLTSGNAHSYGVTGTVWCPPLAFPLLLFDSPCDCPALRRCWGGDSMGMETTRQCGKPLCRRNRA